MAESIDFIFEDIRRRFQIPEFGPDRGNAGPVVLRVREAELRINATTSTDGTGDLSLDFDQHLLDQGPDGVRSYPKPVGGFSLIREARTGKVSFAAYLRDGYDDYLIQADEGKGVALLASYARLWDSPEELSTIPAPTSTFSQLTR